VTPARFRWGMLFIMVGALILLVNLRVLYGFLWVDVVYFFIRFIPFLLIAIGIEKIFSGSRVRYVSYVSTVALVGVGFWLVFEGQRRDGDIKDFFESETIQEEIDPSVTAVEAVLRVGPGSVTVRDATDDLIYGSFGEWSFKPEFRHQVVDGIAELELANSGATRRSWGGVIQIEGDDTDEWYLSFCRKAPLTLKCYGDEADLHLNLSTTPLRDLEVDAPGSDIYLKVGTMEEVVNITVRGEDTKLRLRVPREAGLKVSGLDDPDYLGSVGLAPDGGYYVTPDFENASPQLNVSLDNRFRSLSIDQY